MPAYSLTFARALREVADIENALFDGFPPPGQVLIGRHEKTCIRLVADANSDSFQSLIRRIGDPKKPGGSYRHFLKGKHPEARKLLVDWARYRPHAGAGTIVVASPAPEAPPSDPIDLRRLRDENSHLRASLKVAERRAADAEDIRASILGLTQEPLKAQIVIPGKHEASPGGRTVILHLSDVHYGETIASEEMDGLNRYDAKVAQARLGRFFAKSADLMTKYWKGDPPDEIILCLGGDLISGNIHPELEQTNLPAVPATVREVGEHIAGGVIMLRNTVKCPIRIYSVPGNHGRMTMKPQSKGRSAGSLDLLATDFAEATTRGARLKDVTWYKAQSPDCYFSTYGWHWLLTHGDAMGGRGGGTGFIGPMATIIKGHRKLVDTSWRTAKPVHFVLTAHFHTTGKTTFGWANGSVCSYGEYARDLRADPEPSRQNMLIVNAHYGVIQEQPLYLGVPSEGSLYSGPASVIRPVWGDPLN